MNAISLLFELWRIRSVAGRSGRDAAWSSLGSDGPTIEVVTHSRRIPSLSHVWRRLWTDIVRILGGNSTFRRGQFRGLLFHLVLCAYFVPRYLWSKLCVDDVVEKEPTQDSGDESMVAFAECLFICFVSQCLVYTNELKRILKMSPEGKRKKETGGLEFSGPQLELKHKIFLSHSGVQKRFTKDLFQALKAAHQSPFFDINDDSLPKGEKWYPALINADNVVLVHCTAK